MSTEKFGSTAGSEDVDMDLLHQMAAYQNVAQVALQGVQDPTYNSDQRRSRLREEIKDAEAALSGVRTSDERLSGLVAALEARYAALGILTRSTPPEQIILGQIGYREAQARADYSTSIDQTQVAVQKDAYMLLVSGIVDPLVPNFPIDVSQPSDRQAE